MTLRKFWNMVSVGRWFVAGSIVLGMMVSLAYVATRELTYTSSTTVGFLSSEVLSPLGITVSTDPVGLESTEVADRVRQRLSAPETLQDFTAIYSTSAANTVVITVDAATEGDAVAAANALADEYVARLTQQFAAGVSGLEAHRDQIGAWLTANAGAAGENPTSSAGTQYLVSMGQYQKILGQLAEVHTLAGVASVRSRAVEAEQVSWSGLLVIFCGAALGAASGAVGAALYHALDSKVRSAHSIARIQETVLGTLSEVGPSAHIASGDERIPIAGRDANPFTQSVRELRTVLQASMPDTDGSILVVAAVEPGIPIGFITANLAASFALSGRRVIVVSGDLRQPTLTSWLLPEGRPRPDPLDSVPTRVPNLRVVLPLRTPLDPADYLATAAIQDRLEDLRASADLLVMDAPPTLVAADAAILGGYADATVLIAQEGATSVGSVEESMSRLRASGARPVGVVIASDRNRGGYRAEYTFVGLADEVGVKTNEPDRRAPMTVPTPHI